jgi:hypothetical protein
MEAASQGMGVGEGERQEVKMKVEMRVGRDFSQITLIRVR